MSTIASYFDPTSTEFNACQDFATLSCQERAAIGFVTALLVCSIIFAPFAIPVFRLLVGRCTVQTDPNQTDINAQNVFHRTHRGTSASPKRPASGEAWVSEPKGRSQFNFGGDSACTPLAVLFAATASAAKGRMGTPADITDTLHRFFGKNGDTAVQAGFESGNNYTVEEAVDIANKITEHNLQIMETWTSESSGKQPGMGLRGDETIGQKTWKQVISGLKPGQGAVIQFAGYTLSVRRLQSCWEFFDSHNGRDFAATFRSYNVKPGAYIKRCSSPVTANAFLGTIINSGPGGTGLEGEGGLAQAVQITLIS